MRKSGIAGDIAGDIAGSIFGAPHLEDFEMASAYRWICTLDAVDGIVAAGSSTLSLSIAPIAMDLEARISLYGK